MKIVFRCTPTIPAAARISPMNTLSISSLQSSYRLAARVIACLNDAHVAHATIGAAALTTL